MCVYVAMLLLNINQQVLLKRLSKVRYQDILFCFFMHSEHESYVILQHVGTLINLVLSCSSSNVRNPPLALFTCFPWEQNCKITIPNLLIVRGTYLS